MFELTDRPIVAVALSGPHDGAQVVFEGIVRDHNEGRPVVALEYEAMPSVAAKEGERITSEAKERFGATEVHCIHRTGPLQIGDVAVRVTVAAPHRGAAFEACQYVIDEVKRRVPIWKREVFADGAVSWVNAAQAEAGSEPNGLAVLVDCPEALAEWTIIDVREPTEQAADPITAFEHLSSPKSSFDRSLLGADGKKPLLVCERGVSALLLADDLRREGFHSVWSLTGGCNTLRQIARKRG